MQAFALTHKKYLITHQQSKKGISEADLITQQVLSQRFAALLNLKLLASQDTTEHPSLDPNDCYYLPSHTLLQHEAKALGIKSLQDLYGGVVPYPFLLHTTLNHPIHHPSMNSPEGWNNDLALVLQPYVLKGRSAFNTQDALWTAEGMIHDGPLRIKLTAANAGPSQWIVNNHEEVVDLLNQAQYQPFFEQGVIIEEALDNTVSFSIGQTEIGNHLISYCGEKEVTIDLKGQATYGGSTLSVVQGDYNELEKTLNLEKHKEALRMVQQYEHHIFKAYPQIYASRRNYEVLQGVNNKGQTRLGVLEYSWQADGTSIAELLALEAFAADNTLHHVRIWTKERYVSDIETLDNSEQTYCVASEQTGWLIKSAGVDSYEK